jgi:hypothetical protein
MTSEPKEDKELTGEEKKLLEQALSNFKNFIEEETSLDLWEEEIQVIEDAEKNPD